MIVIGLDPGIAATGYGFIKEEEDGSLTLLDYGVINTASDLNTPERLHILFEKLTNVISLHRPNMAAVEKLFFQKNVRTAIVVGQARGVILLALEQSKIPVEEYTPLEIKQSVAGYGGADKSQMQQMVRALLGMVDIPRPDDAADALAVAITHIHSIKIKMLENLD